MNDTDDGSAPDEVGSVAEEAAKLLGALSGWAREHGEGLPAGWGTGLPTRARPSGVAHERQRALRDGAAECTAFCPSAAACTSYAR